MRTTTTRTCAYDTDGQLISETVVVESDLDQGNAALKDDAVALGITDAQATVLANKYFPVP